MARSKVYSMALDTERLLHADLDRLLRELSEEIEEDGLEELLEDGDYAALEEVGVPYDVLIALLIALLTRHLSKLFNDVGGITGDELDAPFDPLAPRHVNWLRDRIAYDAVGLASYSQSSFETILRRGIEAGDSPAVLARRLARATWVLPQHAAALAAMRAAMQAQGLSDEYIERRLDVAFNRYRRYRTGLIAASIVAAIMTAVQQFAWETAIRAGTLDDDAKVQWITVPDEKRCTVCRPLHLVKRYVGIPFPGGYYGPPAHPLCRCHLELLT